ncbi:MAG: endonuclease III [Candidatus Pacebacteria bacterium]|nr:endonuclease III [Candidatus Paceibacterota bacterium]
MPDKKQRIKKIIILLNKKYKNPKTALNYKTPHELLVATILSAQCTDKRVNTVTEDLFKKYKKTKDYASVSSEDFEKDIRTTGFFRNKAKNIVESSKIIVEKFRSRVPDSMEKLITLPGVARKTANVVLSEVFGKNEGIAVDTHVTRLSQRLGLSKNSNPEKIEKDLMKITEKNNWGKVSNLLISHGRTICAARNPKCQACILNKDCPSAFGFEN